MSVPILTQSGSGVLAGQAANTIIVTETTPIHIIAELSVDIAQLTNITVNVMQPTELSVDLIQVTDVAITIREETNG